MEQDMFVLVVLLLCGFVTSAPSDNSFIVSSTEAKENGEQDSADYSPLHPVLYEMDITANVTNRFAKTLVLSKVRNSQTYSKETTFTVVLPEKAFISEFVMEIGGKRYKAYVKEKEEAKRDYNRAVAAGQSAGHVAVSARDSNRFTVSINIEPASKAVFLLTYEELLERKNNQYELVVNIHPGQIVKHLQVEVHINESRPLKFVNTPPLRSGNEISKNEDKLNPSADIQIINSTAAIVKFTPNSEKQRQFAIDLRGKESDGLSGQFIVQYDVVRDPHGGEVLLQDGYFIHFFAPSDLDPLPKHVVFVLDTSGSMGGRKISQLKDAMKSILDEIRDDDIVNIIEFSNDVKVWDINSQHPATVKSLNGQYQEPFPKLSENNLPRPASVSNGKVSKAKNIIDKIYASGGTNMIEGLEVALYLVKVGQETNPWQTDKKFQPIIIFLTDGEPNIGVGSTDEIVKIVTKINSKTNNVPIFSLSFGDGADKEFLKKLSLKNQGFSRHIYEASDASLQLQEFYKQISSPLLSNVNFKYESEVKEVTKTHFPIYFRGSELVVAGKYEDSSFPTIVNCWGPRGPITLRPTIERPVTSLERLWAYLTVKQTLEKRDSVEDKTQLTKQALDLALKYSFVTDVTSLVVVKPNETSAVDTEEATGGHNDNRPRPYARPAPFPGLSRPTYYAASIIPQPSNRRRYFGISGPRNFVPDYSPTLSISNVDDIRIPLTTPPTTTTVTYPMKTATPNLTNRLMWLTSALNPNGTLTVKQKAYELGEDSYLEPNHHCPRTPVNSAESGRCTLLKYCPEVHHALTDFQVYKQYFCPIYNKHHIQQNFSESHKFGLNKYAGVCCPKKSNSN